MHSLKFAWSALSVVCVPNVSVAYMLLTKRTRLKNITFKSLPRFQKLGSVPRVSHNRDKNPRGTELLNV
jgi:hypothetical protein